MTAAESPAIEQAGRRLTRFGIAGIAVLVLAYLVFTFTRAGQALGDASDLGRVELGSLQRKEYGHLLQVVSIGSMTVMPITVLVIGFVRRTWLSAFVAIGSFAFAAIAAEVLKLALPRPELSALESQWKDGGVNTYPSGHATISTSFVLALILIAAPRWRPWVGILGAAWAATVCAGTLAAGWHRPSDAYGGIALACATFGIAAGLLVARRYALVNAIRSARWLWIGALVVIALSAISLFGATLRTTAHHTEPAVGAWAFPFSFMAITVLSVFAVTFFAWMLRTVDVRQA